MRLDTNAEKAAALLLQWVKEGEPGFPNQDTLDDAVAFAGLAQKDRQRELEQHEKRIDQTKPTTLLGEVAQRANAYPKLVQRIKFEMNNLLVIEDRNGRADRMHDRFATLLRELGEAE